VRAEPFTVASVIVGAAVWTVMDFAPEVPVLPAVSDWVAVTEYVPFAASGLLNV
jgi:hypothetical protein